MPLTAAIPVSARCSTLADSAAATGENTVSSPAAAASFSHPPPDPRKYGSITTLPVARSMYELRIGMISMGHRTRITLSDVLSQMRLHSSLSRRIAENASSLLHFLFPCPSKNAPGPTAIGP